ncbi:hypothetical protein M427DRAFT_130278 [Gonapodya prolifera JEL478]|uniref:Uncharacterized protein n=1 Tax=Gonapodya prolifera (strain JEL478) TaxID=1344416 RepID=A0A139AY43_GONPJ|nr:hypothetical protein M427DRAFT_130278 [Gonapodya prolifera JEL478]|eukprot:KXS21493.1 hypothetical protein M427DRAFT_130278 [Gonapodya prolifera JEL478]
MFVINLVWRIIAPVLGRVWYEVYWSLPHAHQRFWSIWGERGFRRAFVFMLDPATDLQYKLLVSCEEQTVALRRQIEACTLDRVMHNAKLFKMSAQLGKNSKDAGAQFKQLQEDLIARNLIIQRMINEKRSLENMILGLRRQVASQADLMQRKHQELERVRQEVRFLQWQHEQLRAEYTYRLTNMAPTARAPLFASVLPGPVFPPLAPSTVYPHVPMHVPVSRGRLCHLQPQHLWRPCLNGP